MKARFSGGILYPLPDMRYPEFINFEVDRVMPCEGDNGRSMLLGIPTWIATKDAVRKARQRGWHVLGVAKPLTPAP